MDSTYLEERITVTKALIEVYEDAILALADEKIESYKLDTGQTTQWVTRIDINSMQTKLDVLYNRLCVFQQRLNGSATFVAGPAW